MQKSPRAAPWRGGNLLLQKPAGVSNKEGSIRNPLTPTYQERFAQKEGRQGLKTLVTSFSILEKKATFALGRLKVLSVVGRSFLFGGEWSRP